MAILAEADRAQFRFLQAALGLTDGNLSRHLQTLEKAGYVGIEKGYEGRRSRTWVRITKSGSHALADELILLKQIVGRLESHSGGESTQDK